MEDYDKKRKLDSNNGIDRYKSERDRDYTSRRNSGNGSNSNYEDKYSSRRYEDRRYDDRDRRRDYDRGSRDDRDRTRDYDRGNRDDKKDQVQYNQQTQQQPNINLDLQQQQLKQQLKQNQLQQQLQQKQPVKSSRFDQKPENTSPPPSQQQQPIYQPVQKFATSPIQFQQSIPPQFIPPQQHNQIPPPPTPPQFTPPKQQINNIITPPIDPEKLKKEREKEQEQLEEEMRKRREKVEQWRKLKEANGSSTSTSTTTSTSTILASTNTPINNNSNSIISPVSTSIESKKKWSLEEEDEIPLPEESLKNKEQQQEEEEEEEDDDIDPLDAFMESLNNNEKLKSKSKSKLIDEDEFEQESDGEDDKEKVVKKGKKEMLQTDHSKINYPPFTKDFYVEVPTLSNMTETEVLDFRSDLGVKITGKNCPKPIQSWSQAGLAEKIHLMLKKFQYEKPTPIQAQTIPAIMNGRDLIGIARTGSGKTLAFLLPMFRHILAQPKSVPGEGMIGLIMSPTRELALQIFSECKKFTKNLGLRVACIYGGASISEQIADLKRGADIVVCTPGRMIDILCANNRRITNLKRVTFLVLDEADRMFDMGFGPQIMCIVDNIRPDRQTIMFSATFPPKVENAAKKILTKPLEIIAGGRSIVSSDIDQHVEVRPSETRFRRLIELLSNWYHKGQILIFTNRQETTDNLFRQLANSQYQCLSLHGSKDQTDRDETITDFKNKVKTILIATPLASRGLDIKDLNLVVNFDCPDHLEDYVHRVGRTGRAGNKGTAYTFISPDEERYSPSIIKALEQSGAKVPDELKKLNESYERKRKEGKDVLIAPTGFTGRGHKFDAAEENKKNLERKQQKAHYGIDDDDEEDKDKDKEDKDIPNSPTTSIISPTTVSTNVNSNTTTGTSTNINSNTTVNNNNSNNNNNNSNNIIPPPLASDPSLPVGQQAINQILGATQVTSSEEAIKAAQLAASLGMKPAVKQIHPSIPLNISHFIEELEINDYSQQARWKVTHKDALLEITNLTNTTVTTKGTFFPPNKVPGANERKLYLYIEGTTDSSVKSAKVEIKKILDEVQATHPSTGKYSVF